MSSEPILKLAVEINADRGKVWQALSSPEGISGWFCPEASGGGQVGDAITLSFGEGMAWDSYIYIREEGQRLTLCDLAPDDREGASFLPLIDFVLEEKAGKVVVRLVQSGFDTSGDWQEYYDGVRRGWTHFLALLAHYVEFQFGVRRLMFWDRSDQKVDRVAFFVRALDVLGIGGDGQNLEVGQELTVSMGQASQAARVIAVEAPHVLSITLPEMNQANLFIELEPGGETTTAGLWLSTYGLGDSQAERVKSEFESFKVAVHS